MSSSDLSHYNVKEVQAALDRDETARPHIVGILLAGGTSSRFGTKNKLLADFGGASLVYHAAQTLVKAEINEVVVVVGYEAEAVSNAVSMLNVRIVRNRSYEEGISSSLKCGLRTVSDADAVVFLPGDMPLVAPKTVNVLTDAYRAEFGTALAAAYEGIRGNPVLFDRTHFDDLLSTTGDSGGRSILLTNESGGLIETNDAGVHVDVDTPNELAQIRRRNNTDQHSL